MCSDTKLIMCYLHKSHNFSKTKEKYFIHGTCPSSIEFSIKGQWTFISSQICGFKHKDNRSSTLLMNSLKLKRKYKTSAVDQGDSFLTFATMTTTKFFSSILYSFSAVSSFRILPAEEIT